MKNGHNKLTIFRTQPSVFYYDHKDPTRLIHGHSEIDKLQQFLTKEFFSKLSKTGLGESAVDCAIRLLTQYKKDSKHVR